MKQELVTEDDVIVELKRVLAETLRIDDSAIQADSSLINDLGAESLDFLDVAYQLEQAFGIKMARHHVLEHVEEMYGEGKAIDEETDELTPAAVELLRTRFGADAPGISEGMDMDGVPALVSVRSMARGVLDVLDTLPEQCNACGASAWKKAGTQIRCGACDAPASFANGDDLMQDWIEQVQEAKHLF